MTVLYMGVTNNLTIRLTQHKEGSEQNSLTKHYKCYFLVYYKRFPYVEHAIDREKEIKGWTRSKKNTLIEIENKHWRFLNDEIGDDFL